MIVSLEDAWRSPAAAAFFRNVWPMYVHEISDFDTDFYRLNALGRWQPDIVEDWIAAVTPPANLREAVPDDDPRQPCQRAHVILCDTVPVGFVCVGARPFRYMPPEVDHSLAELFVVHAHRGTGAAAEAVRQVIARYPGRWHLRAIHDNARAIAFWRRALPEMGVDELAESREERDVVFTFSHGRHP